MSAIGGWTPRRRGPCCFGPKGQIDSESRKMTMARQHYFGTKSPRYVLRLPAQFSRYPFRLPRNTKSCNEGSLRNRGAGCSPPRVTRSAPHRSGSLAAAAMFTPSPRSVALLTIAPTLSRAASLIDKQECIKAELAGDPKAPVCTGIPRSADPVKRAADPTFSESFKKVLRRGAKGRGGKRRGRGGKAPSASLSTLANPPLNAPPPRSSPPPTIPSPPSMPPVPTPAREQLLPGWHLVRPLITTDGQCRRWYLATAPRP